MSHESFPQLRFSRSFCLPAGSFAFPLGGRAVERVGPSHHAVCQAYVCSMYVGGQGAWCIDTRAGGSPVGPPRLVNRQLLPSHTHSLLQRYYGLLWTARVWFFFFGFRQHGKRFFPAVRPWARAPIHTYTQTQHTTLSCRGTPSLPRKRISTSLPSRCPLPMTSTDTEEGWMIGRQVVDKLLIVAVDALARHAKDVSVNDLAKS